MTCRVTFNGHAPLPTRVYFTEYDEKGRPLGKRTRLIYPNLKPGEKGYATFFLRGSRETTRIVLTGVWNGPWESPY